MVIRIHSPKQSKDKNRGSVSNLVDYLEKENAGLNLEDHEDFFNHDGDHNSAIDVQNSIDSNKNKLKQTDTKFYMMTVNPSKSELEHLRSKMEESTVSDELLFKLYIKDLMDEYAKNFNRKYENGKPLEGKDILYYAKIEHERTYKFGEKRFEKQIAYNRKIDLRIAEKRKEFESATKPKDRIKADERIKELEKQYIKNKEGTIIREGAKKDGNNLHAHIIISRLDKTQTMQLSPMANHKQSKNKLNGKEVAIGFNRDAFVSSGEKLFDKKFEHDRSYEHSYNYYKETKMIRGVGNVLHLSNPKAFAKMAVKRAMNEMIQDKTLQKQLGHVMKDPRKFPSKMASKLEKKAIESVVKAMGAASYTNPVTAGVQVAKQAISMAAGTVSKGMGI